MCLPPSVGLEACHWHVGLDAQKATDVLFPRRGQPHAPVADRQGTAGDGTRRASEDQGAIRDRLRGMAHARISFRPVPEERREDGGGPAGHLRVILRSKHTNDRTDAAGLAEFVRLDFAPEGPVLSSNVRALRGAIE